MSSGIELLQKYEKKLVQALAQTDLLKLSQDLLRYRVIAREMMKTIASLDHKRLDPRTTARYLLHLVHVRVKAANSLYATFLTVLGEVDSEGVAKIGRALGQLHSGPIIGHATLVEQDVGYLVEILAEVSYKWEEISISLKLPIASIEECRDARNNKLKLHKALIEWVCGNHTHAKPPTLTDLREALASDTVQLWTLAGEMEEKLRMKMISTNSPSVIDPQLNDCLRIQYESTNTEVTDGKSSLLEVQVCHRESVSYQWMKDGQPLSESSAYSGTYSAMLLINEANQRTEGEYCCHLSHDSEQLASSPVTVTVKYHDDKKCLLDLYTAQSEIPQDSWPLVSLNTYVDLSLIKANKQQNNDSNFFVEGEIDAILEKRERVQYEDAFSKYERGALVLVEGRPGSGKTTLAHKITKDWANGMVLQNVYMVFLISLREDKKKSDIFKTFFQSRSKVCQAKLEKCSGDRVCFILDGYDEYSPRLGDKSVINQLIHKTYLPLAMVIITSRPVATATLRPKATRRVEILGFTKKQFIKFVNSYPFERLIESTEELDSTKSKLMTYLKACTNVLNMCYLPINACIICFLYSQNLGDNMPKTETDVYKSLVVAIILRKLRLDNPSAQLHSLEDLSGYDKECYNRICSLAFNMTVECKQIVHELPMSLDSLNKSPFRGLLTIDRTSKLFGLEDVLTFLHLTLQEYLAASHIASLPEIQQINMIQLHAGKNHMLTTFKFYCGLVDLQHKVHQFVEITMGAGPDLLYIFHCAYETQESTICYRAMEIVEGQIELEAVVLTPADFTALGYVISTASFLVISVSIRYCLLYEEFIDERWKNRELDSTDPLLYSFETTVDENLTNFKACIEDSICTHISYNYKQESAQVLNKFNELLRKDLSMGETEYSECSSDIFISDSALPLANALKQCTNLQEFYLADNFKSIKSANAIANILKSTTDLQHIFIVSPMPTFSAVVLADGLQHCKHLCTLRTMNIDLCSDGAVALAKALKHCTLLKELKVLNCRISPEGAEAIAAGLKEISLTTFNITRNNIGYRGALALSKEFHFNVLNIRSNNIGSEGAKALAKGLVKCPTCISLCLDNNDIDSSGTIALAEGLSHCSHLDNLSLCNNAIGPDGAAGLAHGLRFCTHLRVLLLRHCNLSIDGIVALAERLSYWRMLTHLDLSDNGIILDGVAALIAGGLQFLTLLHELHLSNNSIDSSSAIALAEGIQFCPLLHTLVITKNTIGSSGAIALAGGLQCKEMKYVNLSHNNIDIESVEALATLVQSSHLQTLDLSHNKIASTGALCLVTELISIVHPTKLNLQINNISPKATKFLTTLLCRNRNLRVLLNSDSQPSQPP